MKIGNFDTAEKILLVAEAGNNHEGKFEVAQELVRRAAESGAHAIKFQTFKTENYVSRSDAARFDRLKSFELSQLQFSDLAKLAHSLNLLFISTPFDIESARFLLQIADAIKVASGDNNFIPLITELARSTKPLIISTGVSDFSQIEIVLNHVSAERTGRDLNLALLHCVSSYPVPPEQVNLRSIPFMSSSLGVPVGFSDHTLGIDASVAAAALGARIIEKHFTLDKQYSSFRDHQLSADPDEMRRLAEKIELIEPMLGRDEKKIQDSELTATTAIRRSIVAGRKLKKGHIIEFSDLTWIRPAGGIPPGEEWRVVGKTLKRDILFGQMLDESEVT